MHERFRRVANRVIPVEIDFDVVFGLGMHHQPDEAITVGEWQRAVENGFTKGEANGGEAHAGGECQDDRQRQDRLLGDQPQRETNLRGRDPTAHPRSRRDYCCFCFGATSAR